MDDTPPPPLPPTRITLDAIEAARAAFEQRVREAAATEGGLPLDDIVIAHGVTRARLDRVPDQWLRGIRVMLRADGALVITKLETRQHRLACGELHAQLRDYAHANGLECDTELSLILRDGSKMTPDVQIYCRTRTAAGATREPVALFEVEVHHRWMPCIIATAALYLDQLPSVDRVVFLKFFPPREEALRANQLKVPATLIVFRRASGAHAGRIEVAQMCSFGSHVLHYRVARTLATPSFFHVPYIVAPDQEARAGRLPEYFTLTNLDVEFAQLQTAPDHAMFDVDMPEGWPPIPVDLVQEFVAAMNGWDEDRVVPNRVTTRSATR